MKFKVGDQVIVTAGKDKGRKSTITKVIVREEKVVVDGCNMYVRHVRKYAGQAGQKMDVARPMATAKIAILNEKAEADRIGYKFEADGKKVRIYKKTGKVIGTAQEQAKMFASDKKEEAKEKKVAEKLAKKEAKSADTKETKKEVKAKK